MEATSSILGEDSVNAEEGEKMIWSLYKVTDMSAMGLVTFTIVFLVFCANGAEM